MPKRVLDQYRGTLSAREVATGMNAASRNASRLLDDAKLLLEAKRFPTACSVAILAIEEAGKLAVFRSLASANNCKELKAEWRRYRDHRAKNATWIIGKLAKTGARTLNDLRPMFDGSSDHPEVLDAIKQLGFYTDCYKRGHWSEPLEVVNEGLARSILLVAEILCKKQSEVSEREIELWVKHVRPYMKTRLAASKLLEWHKAMHEKGLTDVPIDNMASFVLGEDAE